MILIVMGVSGSGKSTVAEKLAKRLGYDYVDADSYHSDENQAKMRAGHPLTDEDRKPWLAFLASEIATFNAEKLDVVLACSALKRAYRSSLRSGSSSALVRFVYLKIDFDLAADRLKGRKHAFMNPQLLQSQFDALEEPTGACIILDASGSADSLIEDIIVRL